MGWPEVFRGSDAVAAGLVTWSRLRGPRFVRIFPDIYAAAGDGPPDLALRSRAAAVLVEGRGVPSGYSAAELLGASCAPFDAPAEVTLFHGRQRAHPGLLVHRDAVAPGELWQIDGIPVTGPMRTAYDLARRLDGVEGVVAVDRLANRFRFTPDLLLNFARHYPRARGNRRVIEALARANRYSGSPVETRLRLLYAMIGIEYEGEEHTTPEGVLHDAGRYTRLVDQGWRIYRCTKYEVRGEPQRIVDEIDRGLARLNGTPLLFGPP